MSGECSSQSQGRHAFLVMAHNDPDLLDVLLRSLDDPRNDIYLHIDQRSKVLDARHLLKAVQQAKIELVPRRRIFWGDFSQVATVFAMLQVATKTQHDYYHWISGADLPLMGQEKFHEFFASQPGVEFVDLGEEELPMSLQERVTLKHFFTRYQRSSKPQVKAIASRLEAASVRLQRRLGYVNPGLRNVRLRKGSAWFSITHDFAEHALHSFPWVKRTFRHAHCGDESVIQTLLWNSRFRTNAYRGGSGVDASGRFIDWQGRGASPRVLEMSDLPRLRAAAGEGVFFARKFDTSVSRDVVDAVADIANN